MEKKEKGKFKTTGKVNPLLKKQKSGNWEDASKAKHHDWAYLHIDSHHSLYIYAFIHSHAFVFMFISLSPSFQC